MIIILLLIIVPSSNTSINLHKDVNFNHIYQSENAKLFGTKISDNISGYSGNGYVTGFDKPNDNIIFTVTVPYDGIYKINIGYYIPKESGRKYTLVVLNGNSIKRISLPKLNSFSESSEEEILLHKGENNIMLISDWGYYNIDYIRVQKISMPSNSNIEKHLVNTNATKEANTLQEFLVSNYGKYILSGQQDLTEVDWIEKNTGKKPVVVGFDFMDYSPSRVEHGVSSNQTEQAIKWSKEGGIVTFSWHWNAPKNLINQPGKEWSEGFRTSATTFDIEYALDHPESEDYKLILRDIDAISVQLKKLQSANVAVLFRPLHEAEGGWFWWGAKGPEPTKKLYKLLYNRITNYHDINNLIWIWNSSNKDWYPGDKYVDIVGYDSYPDSGDYSPLLNKYNELSLLVKNKKLVSLTETGPIPDPNLLKEYKIRWSWFLTWKGKYLKDENINSIKNLDEVYNHKYVLTLDEYKKIK